MLYFYRYFPLALVVVLSGTNNLKSVRFFKLVYIAVRLQYCIIYVSGMHNAVVLCICVCVCLATLMLKCNSESNSSYRLSYTTYSKAQLVQYNAEKVRGQ